MRLSLLVVLGLSLTVLFTAQPIHAQNAFTPDHVKFGPAPPFLPPGAQLAVLEGDPMASSGDFTIRLKMRVSLGDVSQLVTVAELLEDKLQDPKGALEAL